jgi:hypothetical protein
MDFGLPSAEKMRDYLISQGVDPVVATERANVAARQNAAQAARTSALSVLAGAAPARAAGTAAIEAAPAIGRGAVSIGERIAAAPRQALEYLTVPAGVVRNPTTGARIPTRNVTSGRMERTPDYFLPGQQLAQGTTGAVALGGGAAGASALMYRPASVPPADGGVTPQIQAAIDAARARQTIDDSDAGSRDAQLRMLVDDRDAEARPAGIAQLAAQNRAAAAVRERAAPMPPARPEEFRAPSGGLASLFSGPAYQSKGGELRQNGKINWGDSDSAADFFRADKARMETPDAPSMATGGAANGKPDKNEAIHRALDIISHLVGHRR